MSESPRMIVAAIDFGTTYSGYAFSFRDDFENNPLKIQMNNNWYANGIVSEETATCILLDADKKCIAFGFEAEEEYSKILEKCEEEENTDYENYYYFKRFKMALHKNEFDKDRKLTKESTIVDETGKKLPALLVISLAIEFLKDHFMGEIRKQIVGIDDDDVAWIVTIPAIWDDTAKNFMSEAAQKAGIKSNQLTLALEPEAASIYCQLIPTEAAKDESGNRSSMRITNSGSRYMVLDLGGGTADITIHERKHDGTLREICAASGGPWGGTAVDREFHSFLEEVFGQKTMNTFKKKHLGDYVDLHRSFENKKRTKLKENEKVKIVIPPTLSEVFEECSNNASLTQTIKKTKYGDSVTIKVGKLFITAETFKGFFKPPIEEIVKHVHKLLTDCENKNQKIEMILMVGGFSDCELLDKAVRENFGTRKIINPPDGALAVLRGAVIFGHNPKAISSRIVKHTYGYESWPTFQPGVHDPNYEVTLHGVKCCRNAFEPYIHKGQEIQWGEPITSIHKPVSPEQNNMSITIYISPSESPKYVNEPDVVRLGKLSLPLPPSTGVGERMVEGKLFFGKTQLSFEAKNCQTGETYNATFDYI